MEFQPVVKTLILLGLMLCGLGLVLLLSPRIPWVGRLPGDIAIQREGFSLYIPFTSCLLASGLLSLLFWVVGRFR